MYARGHLAGEGCLLVIPWHRKKKRKGEKPPIYGHGTEMDDSTLSFEPVSILFIPSPLEIFPSQGYRVPKSPGFCPVFLAGSYPFLLWAPFPSVHHFPLVLTLGLNH